MLIFVSSVVPTVALFTCVFTGLVYDGISAFKEEKIRRVVIYFCFVLFILNVVVVYNELKQSLIQQTNSFTDFFLRILRFILK